MPLKSRRTSAWLTASLAEYNTLRTEILQRATAQIQICTVAGAVAVAVIGYAVQSKSWYVTGCLLPEAIFLFIGMRFVHQDTKAAAERVVELERAVNTHLGEDALVWEQRFGLSRVGYLERWRKVFDTSSTTDQ